MINIEKQKIKDFILNTINDFELMVYSLEQTAIEHDVKSISKLIRIDSASKEDYNHLLALREKTEMLCYLTNDFLHIDEPIKYNQYKKAVHGDNLIKTWLPDFYTMLLKLEYKYIIKEVNKK